MVPGGRTKGGCANWRPSWGHNSQEWGHDSQEWGHWDRNSQHHQNPDSPWPEKPMAEEAGRRLGPLSATHWPFQPSNKSLLPLSRAGVQKPLPSSLKSPLLTPRGLPCPQPFLQGANSQSSPAALHHLMAKLEAWLAARPGVNCGVISTTFPNVADGHMCPEIKVIRCEK